MADLTWKVTLSDSSVKEEGTDTFDLAWEAPGTVNKIEILGGDKILSCDITTGEFKIGDSTKTISEAGPKKMYFRKRRQVRTDGTNVLEARTTYIFGFNLNGTRHIATFQPALEMLPEYFTLP